MLRLRIENHDNLPDGGPIVFQVDRRGFDMGRAQHLDWTLPDPTRCISSKHCEVRYLDGAYWLYDVSTNGTFVNRSSRRVQSPYKLADGDQLEIGDYIISCAVEGQEPVVAEPPPQQAPASTSDDLWNNPTGVSPPIDRRELLPPIEQSSRAADFLSRVVDMPAPREHSTPPSASPRAAPQPPQQPSAQQPPAQQPMPQQPAPQPAPDPWAPTGMERRPPQAPEPNGARLSTSQVPFSAEQDHRGHQNPYRQPDSAPPAHYPAAPAPPPQAPGPQAHGPQAHGPQAPDPQAPGPQAPHMDRHASPPPERRDLEREFLRQFALGANLPPDTFAGQKGEEFAYELGVLMRIACGNLMQLLNARAAAKTLARSTERTMIKQTDNNPLKFMPSAEEAVRVMLDGKSPSYLDGRRAFEHGFADLQVHQMATYTAMQQALKALLEDLDPQDIASATGTSKPSLLGSNKAKAWETFSARWQAKAGQYEHGMLDAFLMLFSEFYDRVSRQRR